MRKPLRRLLPGRRERPATPPPEVVEAAHDAGLPRHEQVLASAHGDDGTWLLGTRVRLVVVEAGGETSAVSLLGWEDVEEAGWDREEARLRVRETGEYGRPRRTWSVPVGSLPGATDPDDSGREPVPAAFLQLLRERVTASVVVQRRTDLSGSRGVVVACRRNPAGGPLRWTVAFDPGLEPEDPQVRAVAEDLLASLRAELGELADG